MSADPLPPEEGIEVAFGMRPHAIVQGIDVPTVILKVFHAGNASFALELSVSQAETLVARLNRAIKTAKKSGK